MSNDQHRTGLPPGHRATRGGKRFLASAIPETASDDPEILEARRRFEERPQPGRRPKEQ
jgi:hypothetical protein